MTKKQFWQSASNLGFLGGAALFAVNLIAWPLKLESGSGLGLELMKFVVICTLIVLTAKRNATASGPEGYSYGRAVGFVFAMMMFAGIVYGVGRFVLMNFIASEYYNTLNEQTVDAFLLGMSAALPSEQLDMYIGQRELFLGMLTNPFFLIFQGILELVIKGGFLGLVVCAFFTRKPDIFADTHTDNIKQDNESGSE
jgi:hypothetical protein